MQLTKILERFSRDELDELCRRWGIEIKGKPNLGAISNTLTTGRLLSSALIHTDAFQQAVFRWVAAQPGLEGTWAALLADLGTGVPISYLEEELRDLKLWGLIDYRASTRNGFVGTHPGALAGSPANPRNLRLQLEAVASDQLRSACTALGIKKPPTNRDGRLEAIVGLLSQGEAVRAILGTLSAESRELFEWVRAEGGSVAAAQMAVRPGVKSAGMIYPLPTYSQYGPAGDPLLELTKRLLILPVRELDFQWHTSAFVVPTEVERALSGHSMFYGLPLQPPKLVPVENVSGEAPNTLHLLRDVGHLLGFIAAGRCEWRQDGQPFQRSLTAFGKAIKNTDKRYPEALWSLCVRSHLVEPPDEGEIGYTAVDVTAQPLDLFRRLVHSWSYGAPPDTRKSVITAEESLARNNLISLLESLPPDVWITRDSLLLTLAFMRPMLFAVGGDPRKPRPQDERFAELHYFALAEAKMANGGIAIMIPASLQAQLTDRHQKALAAMPPWDESWTIQPDRTIIAPPNAHPQRLRDLWSIAQLEDNQGASIFRLTAESVAGALNRGMTPQDVRALLERGSKTALPPTVERILSDQGNRYGQIKLGSALTYVRSDDPSLIEELMRNRKLSSLQWRVLAPGIAAVENAAPATVLEALRKAGHLPVMETTAGPGPKNGAAAAKAASVALALSPGEISKLTKILQVAIQDDLPLSLKWREGGRTRSASEVIPYALAAGFLRAYNPDSGKEYRISIDTLTSVTEAEYEYDFDDDYDFDVEGP